MPSSLSLDVTNLETLEALGEAIGQACKGGEVLYLTGELGAGKTTLTQSIARGLEVVSVVTSPTFIIVNEYSAKNDLTLAHADLYRVESTDDLTSVGLLDLIGDTATVCVIEWPEKQSVLERYNHIHCELTVAEDKRHMSVSLHGKPAGLDHLLNVIKASQ